MDNTRQVIKEHQEKCNETRRILSPGPWNSEPDRVNFKHAGLDCMLVRNSEMFNWCGYVGVPKTHPAFGKDYGNVEVDVHGGLTYGNPCKGHICHVTENPGDDELYWLGFDCAHCDDLSPGMDARLKTIDPFIFKDFKRNYRDIKYITQETKSLAEQLARMH